jgi:hypothetical protein
MFGSLDRGETQMQAQRAGTNRLIQARMRVYDQAVKDGATSKEAYDLALHVTRKEVAKQRKEGR